MKLYMNGIYRNTESNVLIAELLRAGYVEVKEDETKAEPEKAADELTPVAVSPELVPSKKGKGKV